MMSAMLVAIALMFGSGDTRGGAYNDKTQLRGQTPQLRLDMTANEVAPLFRGWDKTFGSPSLDLLVTTYTEKPDEIGRYRTVIAQYELRDRELRLRSWRITEFPSMRITDFPPMWDGNDR